MQTNSSIYLSHAGEDGKGDNWTKVTVKMLPTLNKQHTRRNAISSLAASTVHGHWSV